MLSSSGNDHGRSGSLAEAEKSRATGLLHGQVVQRVPEGMRDGADLALEQGMTGREVADAAKGMAASRVSGAVESAATDWLNGRGTARLSPEADLLYAWYDTPEDVVFTQHSLHRTDDRTQTNHGVGYRHFTPTDMKGVNLFLDHDLSRTTPGMVSVVNTGAIF